MPSLAQDGKLGGPATLAIALLLITPSVLALFASFSTVHGVSFPASALWFMYQVALYLGYVGVVVIAVMTFSAAVDDRIPRVFVWLMGITAVVGVFLLWYASHIYRSPWYSMA
jgi:hypothetical protein